MLRDDGNFNDIEWNLYLEWYNWILEKHSFAKPTKIIYLRLDPQIAYERIKKDLVKKKTQSVLNISKDYMTITKIGL